jgi:hypothetical protein
MSEQLSFVHKEAAWSSWIRITRACINNPFPHTISWKYLELEYLSSRIDIRRSVDILETAESISVGWWARLSACKVERNMRLNARTEGLTLLVGCSVTYTWEVLLLEAPTGQFISVGHSKHQNYDKSKTCKVDLCRGCVLLSVAPGFDFIPRYLNAV